LQWFNIIEVPFVGYKRIDQETTDVRHVGKNHMIDFLMLKNQEFPPSSDRPQKGMSQNCCDGGLVIVENFLPNERRIGSAITELYS